MGGGILTRPARHRTRVTPGAWLTICNLATPAHHAMRYQEYG